MYEITTENLPIRVWGEPPDEGTLTQARNLANLPFAYRFIALMPDAHVGYGMPIGGVLAALGRVVPHAVGLDIGCGVRAWRTGLSADRFLQRREEVLHDIARSVPQGFEWHKESQAGRTSLFDDVPDIPVLRQQIEKAKRQVGTLGGGNHFLELSRDPDDDLWALVHSGSRNLGKQMAEHYDAVARAEDRAAPSAVPAEWGLASLATDSQAGREYMAAMDFCLRFAKENRRLMSEAIVRALKWVFHDADPSEAIDVHHNYAAEETHFGERVVLHRKGAVRACGDVIIPGSMGSRSYIGRGLGNPESFESCSHGAGRSMGRKQARRSLSTDQVLREMEDSGIRLVTADKRSVPEEAAEAYKDIDAVMRGQRDLVESLTQLTPVGVVKG